MVSACKPAAQLQPSPSNGLPLPQNVTEAVLVNFRPLTDTGRSLGPVWSPDGQNLAYSELSFVPSLYSYRFSNSQPKTQVWVISSDGEDKRILDNGTALFYSKDGSEIYYQLYDPTTNTPSVYAIDPVSKNTRHFLGTEGFPNINMLADGRLVLSEVGTYAALRIFNPANGERQALMKEHPSNSPQNARLSPDGTLLAYPQSRLVIISKPDGSSPRVITDNGGGSAKVWWSPDSQYLAYITGTALTDKLLLADRQGKIKATLFPSLAESGYISTLEWSPDSRWLLVTTESILQNARPTRLFLFDKEGSYQLLLESFLAASPAWSPDGHTLALSMWIGPDADEPAFNIWLADLTDAKTAIILPQSSAPQPKPTPTLLVLSQSLPPDQVINRFWDMINQKDYRAAWSMLSETGREVQRYPDFKAFYECIQQVSVTNVQQLEGDDLIKVYSVKIDYQRDPDCNESWNWFNDFYAVMSKTESANPWQIECFNTSPNCDDIAP